LRPFGRAVGGAFRYGLALWRSSRQGAQSIGLVSRAPCLLCAGAGGLHCASATQPPRAHKHHSINGAQQRK